jgi:acyl dehydratase
MGSGERLSLNDTVEPRVYAITRESIAAYSRYVFFGADTRNIHTDDDVARRAGLPRAVAQGRYPIGYLAERMVDVFGVNWFSTGELDVQLVRPIFPGDSIAVKCALMRRLHQGDYVKVLLDVWLENQHGTRVTTGTASCLVPLGGET